MSNIVGTPNSWDSNTGIIYTDSAFLVEYTYKCPSYSNGVVEVLHTSGSVVYCGMAIGASRLWTRYPLVDRISAPPANTPAVCAINLADDCLGLPRTTSTPPTYLEIQHEHVLSEPLGNKNNPDVIMFSITLKDRNKKNGFNFGQYLFQTKKSLPVWLDYQKSNYDKPSDLLTTPSGSRGIASGCTLLAPDSQGFFTFRAIYTLMLPIKIAACTKPPQSALENTEDTTSDQQSTSSTTEENETQNAETHANNWSMYVLLGIAFALFTVLLVATRRTRR